MDRAYASGAAGIPPDAPVNPSVGYPQAANPGLGAPATKPGPHWYYMITEEIRKVISDSGLIPDHATPTQLSAAISAMIAAQAPQLPAGTILHVSQATAPTGYLKANGALVSRVTYAALFAAIGITFGAGDGATTFALPDLRGEFVRGLDDGRGVDSGRAFGSAQAGSIESHSHTVTRGQQNATSTGCGIANAVQSGQDTDCGTAPTSAVGGSETRPRNVALLACIKY